jgi:hypothetical protein
MGSSQLILPAIYGSLKRKKLVHHIPKDLVSYLQEITDLNLKRNTAILKQIDFLSKIFNKHKIDHVFLKGAALLIIKPYDTMNERMIGDIDILVSEKDLSRSQQLLLDEGFEAVSNEFSFTKGIFPENYNKHLKRIAHPNYIAAVEIHRHLLSKENHLISPEDILENKIQSKLGHWIPSKQNLWQHAILNWQFNDSGMTKVDLSFRSVLDVLYLEPKDVISKLKSSAKATKLFYSLLSVFYYNYNDYYIQKTIFYKWKLQFRTIYKFHVFLTKFSEFISFVFSRTFLFVSSKVYRQNILSHPKLLWQKTVNFWKRKMQL